MASKPTIQSGSKAFGTATSITIVRGTDAGFSTTVDASKTILLWSQQGGGGTATADTVIRGVLTDGNTITFDRTGTGTGVTIYWQLITFASGVTVQHKTATILGNGSATTGTATITGAGSGGRFIIANGLTSASTTTLRSAVRWRITSDTEIEASCQGTDASNAVNAACQVVEWDNATVQTVTISESWSTTTLDKTISTVDTGKTMVFGTGRISTVDNRLANSSIFSLTSTTNLRLTRGGTAVQTITATVYVVSIASGLTVQYAPTTHTASATANATISAVTTADCALHIGSLFDNWSTGSTAESQVVRQFGYPQLTSTTNLRTTQNGSGTVSFNTQVLEFVQVGPAITVQPTAQTALLSNGGTATFTATATSTGSISAIQWKKDGSNISDGGAYGITTTGIGTGSVTSTLVVTNTNTADDGDAFTVDFTDANGTTTSSSAVMTVKNGPTLSGSGVTNGSGVATRTLVCDYVCGTGEFIALTATAGGVTVRGSARSA